MVPFTHDTHAQLSFKHESQETLLNEFSTAVVADADDIYIPDSIVISPAAIVYIRRTSFGLNTHNRLKTIVLYTHHCASIYS